MFFMIHSATYSPELKAQVGTHSFEKVLYKNYLVALTYLTPPENSRVSRQNIIWFDGKAIRAIQRPILKPEKCVIFSDNHEPSEVSQYRGDKNSVIARIIVTASGEFQLQPTQSSKDPTYGIHPPHEKEPPAEFTSLLTRIAEEGFDRLKQTLIE